MKKKLLALIERHNAVVDALSGCDLPVPEGKVFRAMEVWHKLACEGYDITHMAREAGIDAKCDMQAGRITGCLPGVRREDRAYRRVDPDLRRRVPPLEVPGVRGHRR